MYESFFALKENPFLLTPNPRFLFLSKTHNEVYAHLLFGIEKRAGFVEVTGEVGTGKTTILRALLSNLDKDKYRVAFIFNPKLTSYELLKNINKEFGVADGVATSPELIDNLNQFLLEENSAGRTPVLVIDEAQNLSGEVLEQIRLLSNLETEEDKLIQIILVGQPELRHHLSDYSLRQLNQRISVRYQLKPLNLDETKSYVLHRLKIAGRTDGNVFSQKALNRVFKLSGGIPRMINRICDRALLAAYSDERPQVTPKEINQSYAELEGYGEGQGYSGLRLGSFAIVCATLVAVLCAAWVFYSKIPNPFDPASVVEQKQPPTVERESTEKVNNDIPPTVEQVTQKWDSSQSILDASNKVFNLWGVASLKTSVRAGGFDFEQEFGNKGFQIARIAGSVEELASYDMPFIVPLQDAYGGGYIAVTAMSADGKWLVEPAYNGQSAMSTDEVSKVGLQMALLPWVDFASIDYVAVPGTIGENVRRLQFLLGLTGCVNVPTNGKYNLVTMECVKEFQRSQGLVVDGLVGPRTLIHLYRVAGAYDMPHLN